MPVIGGVYIPDSQMPTIQPAAAERPSILGLVEAGLRGAYGATRFGLPYALDKAVNASTPQDDQYYMSGMERAAAAAERAAPGGPMGYQQVDGVGSAARFVAENLAYSLPYMIPTVAGGVVGSAFGPAGTIGGAVAGGSGLFTGTNIQRASEDGEVTQADAVRSLAVAPAQAAADALVGRYLPGAAKLLGGAAATQGAKRFTTRTLQSMGKAAAVEATTETAQQVGERFAAGLPMTTAEALQEYTAAFITGGAVGGVLGVGGGIRAKVDQRTPTEQIAATVDQELELDGATVDTGITGTELSPSTVMPRGEGMTVSRSQAVATPQPTFSPFVPDLSGPEAAPEGVADPYLGDRLRRNTTRFGDVLATPEGAQVAGFNIPSARNLLPGTVYVNEAGDALRGGETTPQLSAEVRKLPSGDLMQTLARAEKEPGSVPQPLVDVINNELVRRSEVGELNTQVSLDEMNLAAKLRTIKSQYPSQFTQKLEASSEEELLANVNDYVVDNAKGGKKGAALAQKLGLLDETGKPTDLSREVSARKAAAAEAASLTENAKLRTPEFQTQFQKLVGKESAPDVQALDPVDEADLDRQIYEALAGREGTSRERITEAVALNRAERTGQAPARGEVIVSPSTAMEALAVKRGLLAGKVRQGQPTGPLELTAKGRKVAREASNFTLEQAVDAAQEQGFRGQQASMFERGARTVTRNEPVQAPETPEAAAAYTAGREWAQQEFGVPETATTAESEAVLGRVGRGDPDADAQARAELKRQIEKLGETTIERAGGLKRARRGAPKDDIMRLQRMVDQGVPQADIEAGIARVQSGRPLFAQPEAGPRETTAERIERIEFEAAIEGRDLDPDGAALERARRRRALGNLQADRIEAAERALAPRKPRQTLQEEVKAERQRRRDEVKAALKAAFDAGQITAADLALGIQEANQGQVKLAARRLSGRTLYRLVERSIFSSQAEQVYFDRNLQDAGDTVEEALALLDEFATTSHERAVIAAVKRGIKDLKRSGIDIRLDVLRPGDPLDSEFAQNKAAAGGFDLVSTGNRRYEGVVTLRSEQVEGEAGTDFETILHEFVHAVTRGNVLLAEAGKATRAKREALKTLEAVGEAIRDHLSTKQAQGTPLTTFERWLAAPETLDYVTEVDEIIAWGMTNSRFQEFLDQITVQGQTLWQRFLDAVRRLLGIAEKDLNALDEVVRASFVLADNSEFSDAPEVTESVMQAKIAVKDVDAAATQKVQEVIKAGQDVWKSGEIKDTVRKSVLGFSSLFQLAKHYYDKMPSIMQLYQAHNERRATMERLAQLFEPVHLRYDQLRAQNRKEAAKVDQLMTYTQYEIDPTKTFDQHEHLKGRKDEARMRRLVAVANQQYRQSSAEVKAIYGDMRALNEMTSYASMALGLYNVASLDPSLAVKAGANPMDTFRESPSINESVQDARDYWRRALEAQIAASEAIIADAKGSTLGGTRAEQDKMAARLSPLEQQLRVTRGNIDAMAQAPYFHLGRHGDYYVTFEIRKKGADVDPQALDKVATALGAAGIDATISRDSTQSVVYIRADRKGQEQAIVDVATKLRDQGLLIPDGNGKYIKSGKRDAAAGVGLQPGPAATVIQDLLTRLNADPAFSTEGLNDAEKAVVHEQKAVMEALIRSHYLEALEDTALAKVLTKRENRHGFADDMVRNFAQRYQLSVNALSGMAATPKFDAAFNEMRNAVNEAKDVDSPAHKDAVLRFDLMAEMMKRERNRPVDVETGFEDRLRAYTHAYFLGASPSYLVLNMTQLGVLAWPELAKTNSWSRSFGAIAKATPIAFKVLQAAFQEGLKAGGKRAADAVITQDALRRAGVSKTQADFIMRMMARGIIDIGGATRELGRLAGGNADAKGEAVLRYAGAFGLYSETFTRLVTALAARELHQGTDVDQYAADVVAESMLNYSPANQARLLGKQGGALGRMTPIVTQFLQYSFQVLEKMYREMYTGIISRDASPEAKRVARRFLVSHATAVTALAGSLGLPFASVMARVVEALVDTFDDDDEPYDATAAYRNFLADTLGPDAAEIFARGVPRALGVDLSQRAGEQDLLPFTRLLTSRQSFKDRLGEQFSDMTGPSLSMLSGVGDGLGMIANGEVMRGMTEMLPLALRGPAKAGQMYDGGYVDGNGNRIPIASPGARAILAQVLGFQPAEKAEFQEAKGDQSTRRGVLTRTANRLRRQITDAIVDGDSEAARDYIQQAQEFDSNNPGFAVLPDIKGSLKRRQRTRALVDAGIPAGVSLKDLQGQQLTQYANY